jgi:hypothetical protein
MIQQVAENVNAVLNSATNFCVRGGLLLLCSKFPQNAQNPVKIAIGDYRDVWYDDRFIFGGNGIAPNFNPNKGVFYVTDDSCGK